MFHSLVLHSCSCCAVAMSQRSTPRGQSELSSDMGQTMTAMLFYAQDNLEHLEPVGQARILDTVTFTMKGMIVKDVA